MATRPAPVDIHDKLDLPVIRRIESADLFEALRKGWDDFKALPSHLFLIALLYPINGLILFRLAFGYELLPLLFPLVAGFALLGPLAAIGFYEISRRRELGLPVSWHHTLDVFSSRSLPAILVLGGVLMVLFVAWLWTAYVLYLSVFGNVVPKSMAGFFSQVLSTSAGWRLMLIGNAIGFLFALTVFAISVVSFPMLVDRPVSPVAAVMTSIKAVVANPVTMATWGLIVAAGLIIGALPFLFGLVVVVPVLGHATWHLYRRIVER